jgi:hypothetical protein
MKKYKRYKEHLDSQIHTKEFKRWFGNSKIVNKSGEPLIVYHGTSQKFSSFSQNLIGKSKGNYGHYGYGFYFSYDVREAKTYGNNILPVYLNIKKPFYADNIKNLSKYAKEFGGYEKVPIAIDKKWFLSALQKKDKIAYNLAVFIIKNGHSKGWEQFLKIYKSSDSNLDLNDVSEWASKTGSNEKLPLDDDIINDISLVLGKPELIQDYPFHSIPRMDYMTNLGSEQSKELTKLIIKDGYDGIIGGTEIVVFSSKQIKSATNNNGNFDKNNNNIFEKRGFI